MQWYGCVHRLNLGLYSHPKGVLNFFFFFFIRARVDRHDRDYLEYVKQLVYSFLVPPRWPSG